MSKLWDRLLRRKETTTPATAQAPQPAVMDTTEPAPSVSPPQTDETALTPTRVSLQPPTAEAVPVAEAVIASEVGHVAETPPVAWSAQLMEPALSIVPESGHDDPPADTLPMPAEGLETLAEFAFPTAHVEDTSRHTANPMPAPTAADAPGALEDDETPDAAQDDAPVLESGVVRKKRGRTSRDDSASDEMEGDNWAPTTPPGRPLKRNEIPTAETRLFVWDRDDDGDIVIRMEGSCIGTQWYGPTLYYLVVDWNDRLAPQHSARVVVEASHLRVAVAEKPPRGARAASATRAARRSDEESEQVPL